MSGKEITVRVKKMPHWRSGVDRLPYYATAGAAGLDLGACIPAPVVISPGERRKIPTGLAVGIPDPGYVGLVFPRSGLASRHGVSLANAVGVIDSDYTGEVICAVQNNGAEPFTVHPGDRIAQLVFVPVVRANLAVVDELPQTERGSGGFGSTGIGTDKSTC